MPHEPNQSLLAPLAPNREGAGEEHAAVSRPGNTAWQPGAATQRPATGMGGSRTDIHPARTASHDTGGVHGSRQQAIQQPSVRPQHRAAMVSAPEQAGDGWANMRDSSVFLRANRHSGRVRLLRVALPVIATLIIVGIAGAYFVSQANLPQVTIAKTAFENGRMVMRNPVLDGVDGKQQPYRLTAREAIQDPKKPKQVELDSISAEVPVQAGVYAHILAGTGFYDGDAKRLDLGGEIEVVTDDGMTAKFKDAAVDIGAGTLKTGNPVAMTTEQAEISAESMFVEDNGAKVVFENRVRMTIFPDKIQALQETASGESGEGNSQ